jgi:rfaE bifunctional protein nucleotidyltransferase chain/domain
MGAAGPATRAALADRTVPLVVDAHDLAPWAPLRPDAVTPNAAETERLLGRALGTDRVRWVSEAGDELRRRTGATGIVVTLDRDGTVVHAGDTTTRTLAKPAPDANANGAGDTFAAALTLALAAGLDVHGAARIGQLAADVVVQTPGTGICTAPALRASLSDGARMLGEAALVAALAAERAAGRRIVFTNGCFDVLHRGHTSYLKQARALGDLLVVAVNDDDSTRRLKGPGRPLNPAADRAGVLAELACVDYVTVFSSDTPVQLIETIEPDVYVKGGDYLPEMLVETPVVEAHGGTVRIVDYVDQHSTSAIIARARSGGAAQ